MRMRRTSRMRLRRCPLGKTEPTKSFGSLAPPRQPRITRLRRIEAETRLSIGALAISTETLSTTLPTVCQGRFSRLLVRDLRELQIRLIRSGRLRDYRPFWRVHL